MGNIIEVKHLSKTFGEGEAAVHALSDININIEQGDIYGIIGMSGAGKSTLVRCFNYLEVPTEGQVIVKGRPLGDLTNKELREARTNIGMIFQNYNLLMQKTVLDNVCFPLVIHGTKKSEAKEKAIRLLKTVGLADKAQNFPAQLSGGQRQRVAIARALASDPEILLCDEATSALDPQTTNSILELLKQINETMGITVIIITHSMAVVQEICKHVAIVDGGVIAEEGEVEEIFNHPKSDAAKTLILEGAAGADRNAAAAAEAAAKAAGSSKQLKELKELHEAKRIRVVFTGQSSFEPVIANMIIVTKTPVNILGADTRDVNGKAKGQMILGLPADKAQQKAVVDYLTAHGCEVEEVTGYAE